MTQDQKILINIKKAKSHLDKIIKMLEEDAYCIDVIQQLNAVEGYIDSARRKKLLEHLNHCFVDGMAEEPATRQQYVDEVIQILKISK